jgi:RecG-like helicase
MFKRFFQRLQRDEGEQRAGTIKAWAEGQPGVSMIATVEPRSIARIAGVVETLRVRPRQGGHSFEADITDGTGIATAVWLGRRTVPGLSIGSRIVVEGRFGGERSRLQILNPVYEFTPGEN